MVEGGHRHADGTLSAPDTDTGFPCTACGACCRIVPQAIPSWPRRADGACVHLAADNRCVIYATRPPICRIGAVALPMSLADQHATNARLCNEWQTTLEIDPSYRVDPRKSALLRLVAAIRRA